MRGTIELTAAGHGPATGAHRGDSVFTWEADRRRILFCFWGSDGRRGVSEGFYRRWRPRFPVGTGTGGQAPGRRTIWRRIDANSDQVTVRSRADGQWPDRLQVTYRRAS